MLNLVHSIQDQEEKTVVEGKTIPYVSSKSVFGTPSSIKLSGAVAFAGERLFHANGWNQHTTWNWTVPSDYDIDYISMGCRWWWCWSKSA